MYKKYINFLFKCNMIILVKLIYTNYHHQCMVSLSGKTITNHNDIMDYF